MAEVKGDPDVVFVVGSNEKKIAAHRTDLMRASPYFSKMFSRGFRESGQREVKLNDVNCDDFQLLVDDCYFRDFAPTEANVHNFLVLANYFQFTDVTRKCCDLIAKRMTAANCLGIVDLSEKLGLDELREKAVNYAHFAFPEMIKGNEYLELSYDRLHWLLSSNDLNVRSEEEVYDGMLHWINHKFIERVIFYRELLQLIRLIQLEVPFINEKIRQLAFTSGCHYLIEDSLAFKTTPAKRTELSKRLRTDGRHSAQKIITVGRAHDDDRQLFIEMYSPAKDSWSSLKTIDIVLSRLSATITEDHKLIIAGDSESVCPGVIIDLLTMGEFRLPPMNDKRQNFAVGYLDGLIYVTGGLLKGYYDNEERIYSVERFDPKVGTWQFVAPMLEERYNHAVASLNGLLYAAGGGANCEPGSNTFESYDPERNIWIRRSSMIRKRTNFYLTAYKGHLYAIGGSAFNCSQFAIADWCNSIERYDPKTDTWTMFISYFSTDHQHHNYEGAIFGGHSLMAIGRDNRQKEGRDKRDGEVLKLCLKTFECKRLAPLNSIRKDLVTVAIPNFAMLASNTQ